LGNPSQISVPKIRRPIIKFREVQKQLGCKCRLIFSGTLARILPNYKSHALYALTKIAVKPLITLILEITIDINMG
jgi:hypothetical protein